MALSNMVLPEPVPPAISTFSRARAAMPSKRPTPEVMVPFSTISVSPSRWRENLRIEMQGLSMASGGKITLTRLPSCNLASTIGLASSMRRPTRATIFCASAAM